MTSLPNAAQQALEALLTYEQYIQPLTNVFGGPRVPEEGSASAKVDAAIIALRAALAEPDLSRCPKCGGPADNGHDREVPPNPYHCTKCMAWQTVPSDYPHSHQPLTIERLRDALVASRIIPPAAVEDPDEYDDGVTLFRIEALHRRITEK